MIQLLLVEDHVLVRQSMKAFLEAAAFEVVGEAGNGAEAVQLATVLQPDLVIMDIHMPGMNGVEATFHIRRQHPTIRVIALTAYDDQAYQRALKEAGVSAFMLKTAEFSELLSVIRVVMADRLPDAMPKTTISTPKQNDYHLTERELEVLVAASHGWTNKQIGLHLTISDRTVQVHLQAIYHKLGASNRTEAVSRAMILGIISPE